MLEYASPTSQRPLPDCGFIKERSLSVESTVTEEVYIVSDTAAAEAAALLYYLRAGKRRRKATDAIGRQEADELSQLDGHSSSSSGSACSGRTLPERTTAISTRPPVPSGTRTYVWRGPKRNLRAPSPATATACTALQPPSSDPDEEDQPAAAGGPPGQVPGGAPTPGPESTALTTPFAAGVPWSTAGGSAGGCAAAAAASERTDRDKEWAALTTWLRMNLHHPRTTKREVLFLGHQQEGRGWHFFLNPALGWDDVSPETKMRLRTLPQETELAFARKYPGKPERDWVKKTQKYRPPGCSVTYAVPLAEMVYSLTAIYYRFEGRPGTRTAAPRGAAAAAAAAADSPGGATTESSEQAD
ncbi:hypothetical protein Agub_g12274 [Astrephomene gubernaculifera]|uniref:Uncharacterized protein n=1 Tax=Astrephomene gubernaculifera TaxID=47775 RepID=A0AAD3E0R3_9CHLO|nr:hypothetical protein Agub_g12274 [Astrephomene gubernaculifera]